MRRSLLGDGATTIALFDPGETIDVAANAAYWVPVVATDVNEMLLTYGAVLLRGFGITGAEEFEIVARAIGGKLHGSNREHEPVTADGAIQTPVRYPADKKLLWHNENSFNDQWPLRLLFCCEAVPAEGGETPLVDSRLVLRHLDRSIVRRFTEHGVRYIRQYGGGLGLDWRTVFATDDPDEVARRCAAEDLEFAWSPGGVLRTVAVRPAVVRHPLTGEMSWFNQAQHWHPACLDAGTREALLSLYDEHDLPRNCQYGDGSPIEDSVMAEILDVYSALESKFTWQVGDVLVIDNVLMAHARNPYSGTRRLLVALAELHRFGSTGQGD